jgi:hypothetical protein
MSTEDSDLAGERAFSNSTNFASETLFSASDFGRKTMHVFKSSNYRLTKAVNYQPSTEVASSPMIKITASSVTIDLNGFTVSRQDTDVNGASCPNAVGIEVGYSPYDKTNGKFGLTAGATFSTVSQPENVTICNGVLDNFGIGIVIHAGVKNVVLENLTITRSALGVVCAGQTAKQVAAVTLKNVTITGDGTDRNAVLTWAKAKLEGSTVNVGYMNYGDGFIMPEQQDPIALGDSDNDVYSGVLLVYTNTATLEQVTCNNLGEETDDDTFTFPVYARNSSNVILKDVTVSGSKSDSMVAGIACDTCSFVTMHNIVSTNNSNTNTATTMGLYFKGTTSNISIDGAQINNNSAASIAAGIYFLNTADNISMHDVHVNGLSTSATVYGIMFNNTLKNGNLCNIHCGGLNGSTTAYGLTLQSGGNAIQLSDAFFDNITSGSGSYALYAGNAVANINIDNINIQYMYASGGGGFAQGMHFDNTVDQVKCTSMKIFGVQGASAKGIHFANTAVNVQLTGIDILGTQGSTSYTGAIHFGTIATNIAMDTVRGDDSTATTGDCWGLKIDGAATTIEIKNSSFDETTATGDTALAYGMWFASTVDTLNLENVTINKTTVSDADTALTVRGLLVTAAATSVVMKNVQVNNTTATTSASATSNTTGVEFTTSLTGATIDGLQVNNTSAGAAGGATYGIKIDDANGVTMKNVQCNGTTSASGAFDLYGLALTTSAKNIVLENIEVNNCTKSIANQTFAFYVENANGMDIKNLSASGNTGVTQCIGARFTGTAKNISIDGLQVNNNTAATAYGLHMAAPNAVTIKNICATGNAATGGGCFGMYAATSAANLIVDGANVSNNSGTTTVGGMYLATADSVQLKNITANNNGGTLNGIAIGIQCGGTASDVLLENIVASGNYGSAPTSGAGGIYFAGTNSGINFKNVVATNNIVTGVVGEGTTYTAGTYAFGIKLASGRALTFEDINCSYNVGPNATQSTNVSTAGLWNTVSCAGMWLVNPTSVEMKNVTCDYNTLGGTSAAAYTFGILLDNPSDVTIDSVSCSHNVGNAHVSGIFANSGSSVSVSNGQFVNNMMQGTAGADVQTNAVTITPNGNLSKHTVLPNTAVDAIGWVTGAEADGLFDAPESIKGAFGIFAKDVEGVSLDTVSACKNTGFRAIGVELLGCAGVQMTDCVTSMQSADGVLFLDDADSATVGLAANEIAGESGTLGRAVTIPALYLSADSVAITPDIFGIDFNPVIDVINLQTTMVQALNNAKLLKDNPTETFDVLYPYYADFVRAEILVRAAVAKKRAWGVAVGTQIQNCAGVQIDNLTACTNSAEKDSAIGLIFANHCTDCTVLGGQFTSNQAWTDSALQITPGTDEGTIDITAMNKFWKALGVDLPNSESDDTYGDYVTSASDDYGILSTTDVTAGRFLVLLTNDVTEKELCTPCGPVAAGIIIGDTSERVTVSDVVCAGNNGNAGQAYGLLHDVSTSAVVQNSQFYQNVTNTCGIAFGLAEFTPQSGSIHFGNTAFGNQYENFVNSNYMVPFAPPTYDFPVKIGYNGDIANLANASVYDNIEVRFSYGLPTDPTHLPDGVAADWTTGGLMDRLTEQLNATMTATVNVQNANANSVYISVDNNGVDDPEGSLTVLETIGGWSVAINTLVGSKNNLSMNTANQLITDVTGTATLSREGFEDISGITFTGTIVVDIDDISRPTIKTDNGLGTATLLTFTGPDDILFYVKPSSFTSVTYTTARSVTVNIDTAIDNYDSNSTIVLALDDSDGIVFTTNIGGVEVNTTTLNLSSGTFNWNTSGINRVVTGSASMASKTVTFGAASQSSIDFDISNEGIVTSFTGTLYVYDDASHCIATLNVTDMQNEWYVSHRTADISFYYAQDGDSTRIFTPDLNEATLSDGIIAMTASSAASYSLANGSSLSIGGGEADVAYSANEASFTVSGTGTLTGFGAITFSASTVYVDNGATGIPNAGETASVITMQSGGVTIAQITIDDFTFTGDFERVIDLYNDGGAYTGARVYVDTRDYVPYSAGDVEARVSQIRANGGGNISINNWTLTFTSELRNIANGGLVGGDVISTAAYPSWYRYDDTTANGAMSVSGTVTASDGNTSVTGLTVSGTVYVQTDDSAYVDGLGSTQSAVTLVYDGPDGGGGTQTLTINIGNISITSYDTIEYTGEVNLTTNNSFESNVVGYDGNTYDGSTDLFFVKVDSLTDTTPGGQYTEVSDGDNWTITIHSLISVQDNSLLAYHGPVFTSTNSSGDNNINSYYGFPDPEVHGGGDVTNAPITVSGTATFRRNGSVYYSNVPITGTIYINGDNEFTGLGGSTSEIIYTAGSTHNIRILVNTHSENVNTSTN